MGLTPYRYVVRLGHGAHVQTVPTTWELIGDMLPPDWWYTQLADTGKAPLLVGYIEDTQWLPDKVTA